MVTCVSRSACLGWILKVLTGTDEQAFGIVSNVVTIDMMPPM